MPACEWSGATYDRISNPHQDWGAAVLDRLALLGDETVIDAGCGSGRVTEKLIARLPRGHVIAVDGSQSMVEAARVRLGDRALVVLSDLLELDLPQRADAVFSTATFHWIEDHGALFTRLRAALRDGGRLAAQCGGEGNLRDFRARAQQVAGRDPFVAHLGGFVAPWNYAPPQRTRELLLAAGFSQARCWLQDAPVEVEHPHEFLSTIVLAPHVQALAPELRGPFIDAVLAEFDGRPLLDYVRLNIDAVA